MSFVDINFFNRKLPPHQMGRRECVNPFFNGSPICFVYAIVQRCDWNPRHLVNRIFNKLGFVGFFYIFVQNSK